MAGILENNRHNVTTRGKIEEFGGFNRHINRNVTDWETSQSRWNRDEDTTEGWGGISHQGGEGRKQSSKG